jgi:3-hydroxyacyl-[acyl-carrier-protein] dehydratase
MGAQDARLLAIFVGAVLDPSFASGAKEGHRTDIPEYRMTESHGAADLERIMRMIPHRAPFLMIDKVRDIEKGKSAVGVKNVTANEPHFAGHFPGRPIMPGVLIVEAMAQTAAVMVVETLDMIDKGMLVYFMTVDKTRFRAPVVPGDVLELHVVV